MGEPAGLCGREPLDRGVGDEGGPAVFGAVGRWRISRASFRRARIVGDRVIDLPKIVWHGVALASKIIQPGGEFEIAEFELGVEPGQDAFEGAEARIVRRQSTRVGLKSV